MAEERVRNVIRDTRRKVKYIIWADQKISKSQMMVILKQHFSNPLNIRVKAGSTIEINAKDFSY